MAQILIVDDEELVRSTLRRILQRDGHDVLEAENGERGLEIYRSQSVDLVIADLFMPVMDGLAMLNELRQEFPEARLIAISGSVYEREPKFLEIAGRMESVRTLAKPFTADQVAAVVNETLTASMPGQSE